MNIRYRSSDPSNQNNRPHLIFDTKCFSNMVHHLEEIKCDHEVRLHTNQYPH
uniref:Uncharacterized protein n=1 Tax=Rhizophora mucronata TaxID=61149 RepID=A0A2P2QM59_RHIMU